MSDEPRIVYVTIATPNERFQFGPPVELTEVGTVSPRVVVVPTVSLTASKNPALVSCEAACAEWTARQQTLGEARKDKNLATEIWKAPGQLGGLPLLEAQNQVDVTDLRQRATDALRPEGRDVDSHALCKKALCMNAWAPARHREQSCRPYLGKTPCPEEVLCHHAAIDVALADDEQRTRFGQHPCCGHCGCCMPKGQREAPLDLFP
jgi:hypothetical protein